MEFRIPRPSERARWLKVSTFFRSCPNGSHLFAQQMKSGTVMPRETLLSTLKRMKIPPETLKPLEPLPGGNDDVLQIVIICDNLFRSFKCGLRDVSMWRNADREQSRARSQMWDLMLQARIEAGQPIVYGGLPQ